MVSVRHLGVVDYIVGRKSACHCLTHIVRKVLLVVAVTVGGAVQIPQLQSQLDSMLLVTFIARQTNVVVCSVWSTLNDDSFMQ